MSQVDTPKPRSPAPIDRSEQQRRSLLHCFSRHASSAPVSSFKLAHRSLHPPQPVRQARSPLPSPKKARRKNLSTGRTYFTLADDARIITYLTEKSTKPNASISAMLYRHFCEHSNESVRNRLRRYIMHLSPDDRALILKAAAECPHHYAHFEQDAQGNKRVSRIVETPPSLYPCSPPSSSSSIPSLDWLKKKLESKDPYFGLEHALLLLTALFNELIERRLTTVEQVEAFIEDCDGPVTLDQILRKVIPPCATDY